VDLVIFEAWRWCLGMSILFSFFCLYLWFGEEEHGMGWTAWTVLDRIGPGLWKRDRDGTYSMTNLGYLGRQRRWIKDDGIARTTTSLLYGGVDCVLSSPRQRGLKEDMPFTWFRKASIQGDLVVC